MFLKQNIQFFFSLTQTLEISEVVNDIYPFKHRFYPFVQTSILIIFKLEDFNQKSPNVSIVVTHVIDISQQCFEVTCMVIKYYSRCSLMYFVYRVIGGSGTEHPNKRTITKRRFRYRVKINFFLSII